MDHFVFLSFSFCAKNGLLALGMTTRSLFVEYRRVCWIKYADPRHIKPGTTSRCRSNLRTVFIFVTCGKKRLLSYRFVRTHKFWLPLVLRAQPPYARKLSTIKDFSVSDRTGFWLVPENLCFFLPNHRAKTLGVASCSLARNIHTRQLLAISWPRVYSRRKVLNTAQNVGEIRKKVAENTLNISQVS